MPLDSTPALSHRGYFAIVPEATWGTDPGANYEPGVIVSENIDVQQAYKFIKGVRASRETHRKVMLGVLAGGPVNFEVSPDELIGRFLSHILPAEATTDHGASNGGTHVFTPGESIPVGLTALISRDATNTAANIWSFTGGRVRKLDFDATADDVLKAVADISFKNGVPSATGITPSYSPLNPFIFHQGSFTVDGTALNVKSFKLSMVSGLKDKRTLLGTPYIQQQQTGLYEISGEMEVYFDNMTQVTKYLTGADASIVLDFTSQAIGSSTAQLKFEIPTAQYTGETPKLPESDQEVMLKVPFTAYQSGSGSPDDTIRVTLLNSKRTAY